MFHLRLAAIKSEGFLIKRLYRFITLAQLYLAYTINLILNINYFFPLSSQPYHV